MMEREDSKIYELARKSKFNRNCSYVFYGLSAASLIVSISNFSTLDEIPLSNMIERSVSEGVARFLLGAAIVELGLGIWNTHRSRTRLNQALQQFR
jgi:NO-binding membrane sensor protein with MHYT domain